MAVTSPFFAALSAKIPGEVFKAGKIRTQNINVGFSAIFLCGFRHRMPYIAEIRNHDHQYVIMLDSIHELKLFFQTFCKNIFFEQRKMGLNVDHFQRRIQHQALVCLPFHLAKEGLPVVYREGSAFIFQLDEIRQQRSRQVRDGFHPIMFSSSLNRPLRILNNNIAPMN